MNMEADLRLLASLQPSVSRAEGEGRRSTNRQRRDVIIFENFGLTLAMLDYWFLEEKSHMLRVTTAAPAFCYVEQTESGMTIQTSGLNSIISYRWQFLRLE